MSKVSLEEIKRQYRVLRQRLSMHAMLRDGFTFKAKSAQILLLACAVVLCATTFASDDLFELLGFEAATSQITLGIASAGAFLFSLTLLIVDWEGQAARHRDAAIQWTEVLQKFRRCRNSDGSWPEELRSGLDSAYWEADRYSAKIPERRFNGLKGRYLRKVAISELKSSYPGCPGVILSLMIRWQHTAKALRNPKAHN